MEKYFKCGNAYTKSVGWGYFCEFCFSIIVIKKKNFPSIKNCYCSLNLSIVASSSSIWLSNSKKKNHISHKNQMTLIGKKKAFLPTILLFFELGDGFEAPECKNVSFVYRNWVFILP